MYEQIQLLLLAATAHYNDTPFMEAEASIYATVYLGYISAMEIACRNEMPLHLIASLWDNFLELQSDVTEDTDWGYELNRILK